MKPPHCHVCGRPVDAAAVGGLVQFADYVPLPDGMCGHPHGLEWFCERHQAAAEALSGKSVEEAMEEMRRVPSLLPGLAQVMGRYFGLRHRPD